MVALPLCLPQKSSCRATEPPTPSCSSARSEEQIHSGLSLQGLFPYHGKVGKMEVALPKLSPPSPSPGLVPSYDMDDANDSTASSWGWSFLLFLPQRWFDALYWPYNPNCLMHETSALAEYNSSGGDDKNILLILSSRNIHPNKVLNIHNTKYVPNACM